MEKSIEIQKLSKHGVKNGVAVTNVILLTQNLYRIIFSQYILVKVAAFGRYYLNIKGVL